MLGCPFSHFDLSVQVSPMLRAILEIAVVLIVVGLARSILSSIVKGVGTAARNVPPAPSAASSSAGTLHRDPVCGTFVSDSTSFQNRVGSQLFFYCSAACKASHQPGSR